MKILGTGLTGMVGSRIVELLEADHTLENLSLSNAFDVRDAPQVFDRIADTDADIVLHLAAKSDVDACENDKEDIDRFRIHELTDIQSFDTTNLDWSKWQNSLSAYAVNVHGTNNIARACHEHHKRLIYISTDFVFDGGSKDPYDETDLADPINFYGRTKRIGEVIVQHILPEALILRIAYPYGSHHEKKKDFVQKIRARFENGQEIHAPNDSIITPTHIDDIAGAIETLIGAGVSGIHHIAGSESLSPYDAALAIASTFDYDKSLVKKTTHEEFYKDKAPRPQYLSLSIEKATSIGVTLRGFSEGIQNL